MNKLPEKIQNFEHWIGSGLQGECPENVPDELFKLIKESGDAYSFYRNFLFKSMFIIENSPDLFNEFNSFMQFSNEKEGHQEIIEFYSEEKLIKEYIDKRFNILEIASEKTKNGITQNSCFLYQSYYEIESLFKVLASIGILNTKDQLDLELVNLRDRSGRLKKGNCIGLIESKLKLYPLLQKTFTDAFKIKLRNTIGHNDYRIVNNTIQSLNGEISVEQDEFFESLYNIQNLNNLMVNYMSASSIEIDELFDCGVLSIGCGLIGTKPFLAVFQLQPFFELENNKKKWLKTVDFKVSGSIVKTNVNAKSILSGPYDKKFQDWLETVKKHSKLKVIIQSIRPKFNASKSVITIDCGDFELLDNEIEKDVEYNINNVPQH